jgi:hypothetical protein
MHRQHKNSGKAKAKNQNILGGVIPTARNCDSLGIPKSAKL